MASLTRPALLLALAGVLSTWAIAPVAPAQTQADFDLCNERAAAQVAAGSASASPRTAPAEPGTSSAPGTSATGPAPGSAATNRMPNAGGPPSTGGPVAGGPAATSPSQAARPDTAPKGMTADAQSNPAYQRAFRDCLKARGF